MTLAATQHNLPPDVLRDNPQVRRIVDAAKAGKVPVEIVSSMSCVGLGCLHQSKPICIDLSEKNPLKLLTENATAVELLEVFSRGGHRGTNTFISLDEP